MSQENDSSSGQPSPQKIPFWKVVFSVMSASFGVQNSKNRERDFSNGSPAGFVVAGALWMTLFVVVLATIVTIVLP